MRAATKLVPPADTAEVPGAIVADLKEGDWIQLTPLGATEPVDAFVTAIRPTDGSAVVQIHTRRSIDCGVATETHVAATDQPLIIRRQPAPPPEPDDTNFQITWVVKAEECYTHQFTARQLREALELPSDTHLGDLRDFSSGLDELLAAAEGDADCEITDLQRDFETADKLPA